MERKFSEQELIRRENLKKLQEANKNPYQTEIVDRTYSLAEFNHAFEHKSKEELHDNPTSEITLAGRVMGIRQTFGIIKDFSGVAQFYVNKKVVDEDTFKKFKEIDVGDICLLYTS
ncbi:MAG: lysine--tRNA ligase, partial [Candidatus Ureaplasma intestinipullorum]|nr:lysine--tRNA ligase [Candidatus Ureaplasma intestinipullorum]